MSRIVQAALRILGLGLASAACWLVYTEPDLFKPTAPAGKEPRPFMRGDPIGPVPGLTLAGRDRTLIVAIRGDCVACRWDLPFYRDLLRTCRQDLASGRVGIVLVTSQSRTEAESWLKAESLDFPVIIPDVLPSPRFRVLAMPALILTDHSGIVLDGWVGERGPSDESMIMETLCSRT